MADAEAPMAAAAAAEAKVEEVEKEEGKGPRHYQIEHPYVCIGEPRVEYAPTSSSSSSSSSIVVEITWKRVRQYVTTIDGTSTLDRRGPVETLGSSSSSFDAAALLAASEEKKKTSWENPTGDVWFDVVASFPPAAHLAPFLPGSLLGALSFDLDRAIAERPPPLSVSDTVLYKQELTILDTHIHDDRLVAIRDLLDEIGAATPLADAKCGGACYTLHRRELEFLKLPCSHAFHRNCIFKAFQRETRCPTCRRSYRRNNA